jgi:Toprim domain
MTTNRPARELAAALSEYAEAVCRTYLSNGKKQGNHWVVGDIGNNPGQSLYVRLTAGQKAAGKWTDAATGEHGDLLDLIQAVRGFSDLREAMDEARAFLALPRPPELELRGGPFAPAPRNSPESARRLFRAAKPIAGTPAAAYLASRGLVGISSNTLRYHSSCYYKAHDDAPTESWPALLAAITDIQGTIMGVHRTWLDRSGAGKAPIAEPRKSMGHQFGNGARFSGLAEHLMVAGEGLESVLSVRVALPRLPAVAGLSANHLAVLEFAPGIQRLYIARDGDAEGTRAADALRERADKAGIPEVRDLYPYHDDFNADLQKLGPADLAEHIAVQLDPADLRWLLLKPRSERAVRVA